MADPGSRSERNSYSDADVGSVIPPRLSRGEREALSSALEALSASSSIEGALKTVQPLFMALSRPNLSAAAGALAQFYCNGNSMQELEQDFLGIVSSSLLGMLSPSSAHGELRQRQRECDLRLRKWWEKLGKQWIGKYEDAGQDRLLVLNQSLIALKNELKLSVQIGDDRETTTRIKEQICLSTYQRLMRQKSSDHCAAAIQAAQNLIAELPETSPSYSRVSSLLAECLLITWEETQGERNRDEELLQIIATRINGAVRCARRTDPWRAKYVEQRIGFYTTVRNFSARLEDDFWAHEYTSLLNRAITFGVASWDVHRDHPTQAMDTACNLGNLYRSRYDYLGRNDDLDSALFFSNRALSEAKASLVPVPTKLYTSSAMRMSDWSLFEDNHDQLHEALRRIKKSYNPQDWDRRNDGVNENIGSGDAVSLDFESQIYRRMHQRRRHRTHRNLQRRCLDLAVQSADRAVAGMLHVDPGRLLRLNELMTALLWRYQALDEESDLTLGIGTALSALKLMPEIWRRRSISARASQRWSMQTFELYAAMLLHRHHLNHRPADLAMGIFALKVSIQGSHGWAPRRPMLFHQLRRCLYLKLRELALPCARRLENTHNRIDANTLGEVKPTLMSINPTVWLSLKAAPNGYLDEPAPFSLWRYPETTMSIGTGAITSGRGSVVEPRGCYEFDLRLTTDVPGFVTAHNLVAAKQIQKRQRSIDPLIAILLENLDVTHPDSAKVNLIWNRIYCEAGPSLKRAEMLHMSIKIFIAQHDFDTALKLADYSTQILDSLEVHLLGEKDLPEIRELSNLAVNIAVLKAAHSRDPWEIVLGLEAGRELGSRSGMNNLRSSHCAGLERVSRVEKLKNYLEQDGQAIASRDPRITATNFEARSRKMFALLYEISDIEDNLLPFGREACLRQAEGGPIVQLISSELGSFALIITSAGAETLSLLKCPLQELRSRLRVVQSALIKCEGSPLRKGNANQKLLPFLAWLWYGIAEPIVKRLKLRRAQNSSSGKRLPRIKWVCCGIFSQIPIHAAGVYTSSSSTSPVYLDQYAISSYLSSIRSSIASRKRKPLVPYYANSHHELTIFGMSSSPPVPEGANLKDLDVEAEKQRIFANTHGLFTNNFIDRCNIGIARNMLHWARLVHFTCHGLAHASDPTKSRLVLLNDGQEPCTVAQIRDMETPNALLVFLSACHSAVDPGAADTDEITHLAKAFLLSGFPTVIGTLWQAYQDSAIEIAGEFYDYVAKGWPAEIEEPERDLFPRALHHAVGKWRDAGNQRKAVDWASWVCFSE